MKRLLQLSLLVLLASLAASANDAPKQMIVSIKLLHAKPSELLSEAFTPHTEVDGRPGQYTPPVTAPAAVRDGVSGVIAFDLDNSVIAVGTEPGIAALREFLKHLDVAPRRIQLYPCFVEIKPDQLGRLVSSTGFKRIDSKLIGTVLGENDLARPVWDEWRKVLSGRDRERASAQSTFDFPSDHYELSLRYKVASRAEDSGSVTITLSKSSAPPRMAARDGRSSIRLSGQPWRRRRAPLCSRWRTTRLAPAC